MELKHVALYAKGHYESKDLWNDLKACLTADGYDANTDWWKKRDTVSIITNRIPVIFKDRDISDYTQKLLSAIDPNFTWKYGYVHKLSPNLFQGYQSSTKDFDLDEAIVRFFLSELCMSKTVDLGGLPEPNSNVLPLKNYETNEHSYTGQ